MSFLVMNLMKWLKVIFYVLFFGVSGSAVGIKKAFLSPWRRFESAFIWWATKQFKIAPANG